LPLCDCRSSEITRARLTAVDVTPPSPFQPTATSPLMVGGQDSWAESTPPPLVKLQPVFRIGPPPLAADQLLGRAVPPSWSWPGKPPTGPRTAPMLPLPRSDTAASRPNTRSRISHARLPALPDSDSCRDSRLPPGRRLAPQARSPGRTPLTNRLNQHPGIRCLGRGPANLWTPSDHSIIDVALNEQMSDTPRRQDRRPRQPGSAIPHRSPVQPGITHVGLNNTGPSGISACMGSLSTAIRVGASGATPPGLKQKHLGDGSASL
jgi:hypothetical protein